MKAHRVHVRTINAPADAVGRVLDTLGSEDDLLWPADRWPPDQRVRFDRPLAAGAQGGHGSIRYTVIEHEPGNRLTFRFDGGGLDGTHGFEVHAQGARRTRLTHSLSGELTGAMRLLWPTLVQPIHDAYVQDILDMAELATTGRVVQPYRQPRWLRLLNRLESWRQRRVSPNPVRAADRQ